jgi:hypothetical protein
VNEGLIVGSQVGACVGDLDGRRVGTPGVGGRDGCKGGAERYNGEMGTQWIADSVTITCDRQG